MIGQRVAARTRRSVSRPLLSGRLRSSSTRCISPVASCAIACARLDALSAVDAPRPAFTTAACATMASAALSSTTSTRSVGAGSGGEGSRRAMFIMGRGCAGRHRARNRELFTARAVYRHVLRLNGVKFVLRS